MTGETEIIDVWMQHPNLNLINHPMLTAARCLEELDKIVADQEVKALFLGENAKRVFGLS